MPPLGEEIVSEIMAERSRAATPSPAVGTDVVQKATADHAIETANLGVIKGDFAKAMAPSLGETTSLGDEIAAEVAKRRLGYAPARAVAVTPQTGSVIEKPRSLGDELLDDLKAKGSPLTIGLNKPQRGDTMLARFGESAKPLLVALSWEENHIVKGLSNTIGIPKKEDVTDYTYRGLLKDLGADDNPITDATGLMLSIMGVPSTYLSFGAPAALKVGVTKAFTREGRTIVDNIIRETAHTRVLQAIGDTKKPMTDAARNSIIQSTKIDIEQQILKRFGEINSVNKDMKVLGIVEDIPERVISKGGAKFDVPFSGGKEIPFVNFGAGDINFFGKTVIPGKAVAAVVQKSGLANVPALLQKSDAIQSLSETGTAVKKVLGDLFVHEYGVDQNLVRAFRAAGTSAEKLLDNPGVAKLDAIKRDVAFVNASWKNLVDHSETIKQKIYDKTAKAFTGWDTKQLEEFGNASIAASLEGKKISVTAASGDRVVQNALDHWFGQGKYKGKGLADQFADKSLLVEDKRLANWFPGITEAHALSPELKLPNKITPSKREYLAKRTAEAAKYTRDPVKAIATRATEIAFSNIQDRFYEKILEKGLGSVKKFANPADAFAEGYAPLIRPFSKELSEGIPLAKRIDQPTYYAKQEFVDQYNKLVRDQGTYAAADVIGKLTLMPLWKPYVTSMFTAFHARNFNSNIVLNAMRIGLHAVDPKKFAYAVESTLRRSETLEPKGWLDKSIRFSTNLVFGKNKEKVMTNVLGEELTQKSLIDEATKYGAIRHGFFQADIGGAGLNKTASELWGWQLNKLNPFSENFSLRTTGTKFGDAIETQARLVNYLTWRMKGLSPKTAAMETNAALYDYGAITKFEKALNQNIIPFYTFSKKNVENYIRLASYRPAIITAQMKYMQQTGPTEEELKNMPEWARTKFVAKLKGAFYTNGMMPIEDVIELVRHPADQAQLRLNPVLRYLGERKSGRDLYSDRPLEEINNANEFKGIVTLLERKDLPNYIRKPLALGASFLKLERDERDPRKIIGDPDKLHMLRAGFTSRWQSVMGLLSNEERAGYDKAVQLLLGVVRIDENPEMQLSIAKNKASKELRKMVSKRNMARAMDVPYFVGDSAEDANYWINSIKEAASPEELKGISKEADVFSKAYQEGRTKH